MELLWLTLCAAAITLLLHACRDTDHPAEHNWFELLPHLQEQPLSKKRKGRIQRRTR